MSNLSEILKHPDDKLFTSDDGEVTVAEIKEFLAMFGPNEAEQAEEWAGQFKPVESS